MVHDDPTGGGGFQVHTLGNLEVDLNNVFLCTSDFLYMFDDKRVNKFWQIWILIQIQKSLQLIPYNSLCRRFRK